MAAHSKVKDGRTNDMFGNITKDPIKMLLVLYYAFLGSSGMDPVSPCPHQDSQTIDVSAGIPGECWIRSRTPTRNPAGRVPTSVDVPVDEGENVPEL